MRAESLKGHLDLLLLSVLREQPAHGYAVVEVLRARSGGIFDLPEGTVYPALHRLEAVGLLSSHWSETTGRRRRVYRVTAKGLRSTEAHRREWQTLSGGMNAVLGA